MHCRNPTHTSRAFSLIELLTVVAIIGIVLGLGLPALARILDGNKVASGVNTLVTAVATTRLLSASEQPPIRSGFSGGYSGTALVVTPAAVGDLRLTFNDLDANDVGVGLLEAQSPVSLNGYRDMEDFDFIRQAAGTRLLGITRVRPIATAPGELQFLEAPFAIRFNENGNLVAGPSPRVFNTDPRASLLVHYDSDLDGQYETNRTAGSGGTRPATWDPSNPPADAFDFDPGTEKQRIGTFDRLESVIGVRIVRIDEDPADVANPKSDYADVFFSRTTGVPTISRFPGSQE